MQKQITVKEQIMDYIILDKNVTLNGVDLGNFIFVNDVNIDVNTGASVANINISNTSMSFAVAVTNNDIKQSIQDFFDLINDKE